MKAKILSMQRVNNHGSFLQSFALKSMIEKQGAEVEFIDIKKGEDNSSFAVSSQNEFSANKRYQNVAGRFFMKLKNKKQRAIFASQGKEFLKLTDEPMNDDKCDTAFIGSDEVFNCSTPSSWGVSTQLFGDIPGAKKVVTYAASCGRTTLDLIPDEYKSKLKNALLKLSQISVRDNNTALFTEGLLENAEIEMNLDPVLVYDFSEHIKECNFSKDFLLLYSYTNRITIPAEVAALKAYAKENNLEIVCAGVFQHWCKHNIPVTSFELLGYFDKARCVVTDTFHGTIMSVIRKKNFVTVIRDSNRNKLCDLLERLCQSQRIADKMDNIGNVLSKKADFTVTEKVIEKEKKRTEEYIKRALA